MTGVNVRALSSVPELQIGGILYNVRCENIPKPQETITSQHDKVSPILKTTSYNPGRKIVEKELGRHIDTTA